MSQRGWRLCQEGKRKIARNIRRTGEDGYQQYNRKQVKHISQIYTKNNQIYQIIRYDNTAKKKRQKQARFGRRRWRVRLARRIDRTPTRISRHRNSLTLSGSA